MAPLNNFKMVLEDDKIYKFQINTHFPVTQVNYKNQVLYRYIYTYNNSFHMEVFLRHDDNNVPNLIHTFTLDPVDYIPLISELLKEITGVPASINLTKITPTKNSPTKFHNYVLQVEY